jgi:hypothetical protein
MKCEGGIDRFRRADQAKKGACSEQNRQATFADGHGF